MGAHSLGAAAYAAKAAALAAPDRPSALEDEVAWQLDHLRSEQRTALQRLPLLGMDPAGPLGAGLLASGVLAVAVGLIQADLHGPPVPGRSDSAE
jgi:hypothetical protein